MSIVQLMVVDDTFQIVVGNRWPLVVRINIGVVQELMPPLDNIPLVKVDDRRGAIRIDCTDRILEEIIFLPCWDIPFGVDEGGFEKDPFAPVGLLKT